jgi:hypothetical protein
VQLLLQGVSLSVSKTASATCLPLCWPWSTSWCARQGACAPSLALEATLTRS